MQTDNLDTFIENPNPGYMCDGCLTLNFGNPDKMYVEKYPLFHFCETCTEKKVADQVENAVRITKDLGINVLMLPFPPSIHDYENSYIFPDGTCIHSISAVVEEISLMFVQDDEDILAAFHQINALFASKFDECVDDERATSDLRQKIFAYFVACVLETAYDTYTLSMC